MIGRAWRGISALIMLAGLVALTPVSPAVAAGVVGDGTPASCTDAALKTALTGGGLVTFNCGPDPVTIPLTEQNVVLINTEIDGGGLITLDGQDTTRHFTVGGPITFELQNITLTNGSATEGGSIQSIASNITLTNVTLTDNAATTIGGGAVQLVQGTFNATNSTISNNTSNSVGGGIFANNTTIALGGVVISGNEANAGDPSGGGGGIFSSFGTVTITNSTISGNSANNGGGLYNLNNGTVSLTNSTVSGNDALADGGGIYVDTGNLTLTGSTVDDNSVFGAGSGGMSIGGSATVTNSTISNNFGSYGAIVNTGTVTVTNSTLSGNASVFTTITGGTASASVTLQATIIEDTAAPGVNCDGNVVSLGENLSDDGTCNLDQTGDLPNTDPLLGTLQDNGGPTFTHLPGDLSPAIGAAPSCPAELDQRGVSRPQGSACDIGAVEIEVLGVATPVVTPSPSNEGESVTASASFTNPDGGASVTCTVDYDDGDGPQLGVIVDDTCTGPAHTYIDDNPTGTPSDSYTATVEIEVDATFSASNSVDHTVNNVAPVIDGITTNGPVPQGQPVTVTVDASDAGLEDTLSYSFDCDNDGSYEVGPQAGNSTNCALSSGAGTTTIGVQVEDDDTGVAVDSVDVGQTVTLCVNYLTGAINVSRSVACPAGTLAIAVPGPGSTTFCINPYTGALAWSPGGACGSSYLPHVVPDDGPLSYCQSLWTGKLRVPRIPGQCNGGEIAGVIPG